MMNSAKELVREKMHIQDVIGSYITLVPAGKNYKACCPFHIEKTPSFQVNTEKQMFYCFGCKKGGDIFSFVQEIEHCDFKEALKLLADKAGIDIHQSAELAKELQVKKKLIQIHEFATRFYQLCLMQQQAVLDYLISRGIVSSTLKQWRIGYAPDDFQALTNVLLKKGFTEQELILSGLVGKSERGLYDRFRGRIMFPITDSQGVIVAFSGRIMPGTRDAIRGESGKYINSPETTIYHKSSVLFGFSFAKKTISELHKVTIVEGQFDALLLHQSGHVSTVALSGTAATDRHMEQIARFAQEIIIATDGDRAGIASAHKIAMLGYRFNLDVSLVILPEGKDPADIIAKDPTDWNTLIQHKKDYITFHGEITAQQTLRERIISVETHLFPLLAEMQNNVHRDAKLQSIANQLQVSQESIRAEFQKFIQKYSSVQISQFPNTHTHHIVDSLKQETKNSLDTQLDELLIIYNLFQTETKFWFDNHPQVVQMILEYTKSITDQQLAAAPIRYESLDHTSWQIRLDTLWLRIQQIQIDRDIKHLRNNINTVHDEKHVQDLQQQLLSLQSKKESLIRSLAE